MLINPLVKKTAFKLDEDRMSTVSNWTIIYHNNYNKLQSIYAIGRAV